MKKELCRRGDSLSRLTQSMKPLHCTVKKYATEQWNEYKAAKRGASDRVWVV